MSEFLLIHYKPGQHSALQYWAIGGDHHPSITLAHGSLEELKSIARGKKVSVLIDAHYTTLESVSFPSKNRNKQLQAVPFAMEDHLAEDIEDTHFALGKEEADKVSVIAIKRELLQSTLDIFNQQQIRVTSITADSVALPGSPDKWCILLDEDSALIKTGHTQAHCCDRENLPQILLALLKQNEIQPDVITYYFKSDDSEAETLIQNTDIPLEPHTYQNHPLEIFVQHLNETQHLNLLQGEFTPTRESNTWLKPWKAVASLAGLWLILQLVHASILSSQLNQKNIILTKQIEAEFRRAIPDTKNMSGMKKRVERRLNELSSANSGSSNASFLNILSKTSVTLGKNKNLDLHGAIFRNNYIDVELTAKSLQDIEQVKNDLNTIPGINAVLSTSVEKGKVKGRLRLEAKG